MGTYLYGSATQNQPAPVNPSFNGNNGVPLLSYDPAMSLLVDVTKSVGMGLAPFAISALKQQTSQNPLQQVANIVNRTTPAPRPTPKPPVATVTQPTAPATYNQPYAPVTNVTNTSVNIPDLFKAPPLPPVNVEFGSLPSLPQAQAARLSTNAGTAPIPAAVSMGSLNLPMAAAPPVSVAQGSSPVNLIPQQARADQPLPPVSPEPLSRPSRPIEMPPVAPRYAQPPMAPPNPYGQMPPVNPYARPPMPMPPQFVPQRYGDMADLGMVEPRRFYQPPPPPRTDLLARFGRGLQRFGAGLNPNIAAADMAKAKAEADVRMKMIEMDAASDRNYADNRRAIAVELMQQSGQDRRLGFTQDNENFRAYLKQQTEGRLGAAQALETLSQATAMAPQNQADYALKFQMLQSASQALGQDFTGMINQTSTAGSEALMKKAIEMKKDALGLLKQQNELQMQPIENDIKRMQLQNAQNANAMAPLEYRAKNLQIAKTQQELTDLQDPEMRSSKRAEALAKSQDIQRRAGEDQFAAIQKRAQMGATLIAQANQMLANPMAQYDERIKTQAKQLLEQGQSLQQAAYVDYQRPLLKPMNPGTAAPDQPTRQAYLLMNGMDPAKAAAMSKEDGWLDANNPAMPSARGQSIGLQRQTSHGNTQSQSLRPRVAGQALQDRNIVDAYLRINGNDPAKARAMAEADGWKIPSTRPGTKIGMR